MLAMQTMSESKREKEMQILLLNDLLAGWLAAVRVCGPRCEINCGVRQRTMVDYLIIHMNAVCYYEYREILT